jgi:GTP-binding protein HflX
MEEAVSADLVLHVIDASHPQHGEQREVGEQVLTELGVDLANVIDVYNKADRVEEHFDVRRRNSIVVSALTGENIGKLIELIRDRERAGGELLQLEIPHAESRLLAKLHEVAEVHETRSVDEGTIVTAWVPHDSVHLFAAFARTARQRRAS